MASTVRGAETQTALTARLPLPLPGTRDDMKGRCAATLRRATETSNIHEKTRRFLFVSVCRSHPGRDCVHFHSQMVEARNNMNATSTALEDPWTLSHSQARIDTFPRLTVTSSPRTKRRKANAESTVGTQIGVFPRHDRAGVQVRGSPKLSAAPNMLCFYAGFSRFTPSRGFARLRAALTIIHTDGRYAPHRASADGAS